MLVAGAPRQRRPAATDANGDGAMNITDGIFVLNYLFLGGETPGCIEAANGSTLNFVDESVKPVFRTTLDFEQLKLEHIDSRQPEQPTSLVLDGKIGKHTRLALQGELRPFRQPPGLNLKGSIDAMDLPQLSSYTRGGLGLLLNSQSVFTDPLSAIYGAVAGYLSLWLVYHLFRLVTGKEGMGYGDFKLLAAIGAWLGWQYLPLTILLSAVVGAIVGGAALSLKGRESQTPIPFGPFLAAAGWIAMMWGSEIMDAYLTFSGLR